MTTIPLNGQIKTAKFATVANVWVRGTACEIHAELETPKGKKVRAALVLGVKASEKNRQRSQFKR